jgi:hypothetical protein
MCLEMNMSWHGRHVSSYNTEVFNCITAAPRSISEGLSSDQVDSQEVVLGP